MRRAIWVRRLLLLLLFLSGCGTGVTTPVGSDTGDIALVDVFPPDGAIEAWSRDGKAKLYDEATLFDLVNGQADAFFAYNFQQVAVQRYTRDDGANLRIELWALASPADAYGLFTRNAAGDPETVGNDGDVDPGRRLAFWQDRYYAQVRAREPIPDETLLAFGEAVAASLPEGGEVPDLVSRLPTSGKVPRSTIFFRKEISIQDDVWLGGENVLGLDAESRGVLAAYDLEGGRAFLLAVRYPGEDDASGALARLTASDVANPVVVEVQGDVLGAVFGAVDTAAATQLLQALLSE